MGKMFSGSWPHEGNQRAKSTIRIKRCAEQVESNLVPCTSGLLSVSTETGWTTSHSDLRHR